MGQFQDDWVMGILAKKKLTSDWSDTVAKWLKHLIVDQRMRFETESGKEEWYEGVISSYNGLTGKYGLYFPCDGKTEDASFNDEDMELID